MAKWWTGAAVTALWFLHTAPARAQHLPPDAGPCMPEPLPFAAAPALPPGAPPQYPPGPVAPLPAELALPANLPNAWDERVCNFPACYVFFGASGLTRQRMGRGVVALTGPATGDTGLPIAAASGAAQTFHDIAPKMNWGPRVTLGYHWDDQAFEVSGFYLLENDSDRLATSNGRLNTFFVNQPVGFLGNTGLFRQADVVRTGLQTTLANGEANYRWWVRAGGTCNWLLGVRYLDIQERLSIFVADDVPAAGGVSPLNQATYAVRVHNRIIGPQLGLEGSKGVCHFLAVTGMAKAGFGANITDRTVTLTRGDGRLGIGVNDDNQIISHFYEAGLYLDWCLSARARLRTGYNVLFAADIDRGEDKVGFNLLNPLENIHRTGDTFYHGPTVELQVVF